MAATITHLRPWVPALTWGDRCRIVRRSYSKRLGRAKTMTTREFAAVLGIPAGTYGPWESGGQPSDIVETAKLIASITGCDAVWLAGFDPAGQRVEIIAEASEGRTYQPPQQEAA